MLDIKYIKENPDEVIARLAKKGKDAKDEIEQILSLDGERRALIAETEAIKAELIESTYSVSSFTGFVSSKRRFVFPPYFFARPKLMQMLFACPM